MTQNIPAISIADFLKCIRERLDEAAAISKAAEACAEAGHPEKGVDHHARRRATRLRGEHVPERGELAQPVRRQLNGPAILLFSLASAHSASARSWH